MDLMVGVGHVQLSVLTSESCSTRVSLESLSHSAMKRTCYCVEALPCMCQYAASQRMSIFGRVSFCSIRVDHSVSSSLCRSEGEGEIMTIAAVHHDNQPGHFNILRAWSKLAGPFFELVRIEDQISFLEVWFGTTQ